jgi:hypothetical protein
LVPNVEVIPPSDRKGWGAESHDQLIGEVLRERLAARGVREVLDRGDGQSPATLQLSVWALGLRSTGLTHAVIVPWYIVSFATLGLVPVRDAQEYAIELRAVDTGTAPGWLRISRRSYVLVCWGWSPFVFAGKRPIPSQALHREGLSRAIDEALDEVLPPADPEGPGPVR